MPATGPLPGRVPGSGESQFPLSSLTTFLLMLVSWFVTVTDTAGIPAPVVSVTIPVMVPKVACPESGSAVKPNTIQTPLTAKPNRLRFIIDHPREIKPSIGARGLPSLTATSSGSGNWTCFTVV